MSIDPKKVLTEEGWKDVAPDCKGKDKELVKALFFYWTLEDDDYEFRIKALTKIAALAGALKTAKEVTADPDAVKYLVAMINAAKAKQGELAKAKAEADKVKAAGKKAEADEKKRQEEEKKEAAEGQDGDEEEDEQGADSFEKLKKTLVILKTAKKPYYFLYCKDKPYGLVISKNNISANAVAKKELSQMAGGSTTAPKFGQCRREGDKLIFDIEKPVPGMAKILQKWIKESTGLRFTKLIVGDQSADDEDAPTGDRPALAGPAKEKPVLPPVSPKLAKAPEDWRGTQRSVATGVQQLQAAVRKSLAGEDPKLVKEVEENVAALDGIAEMLGNELPDIIQRAIDADDVTGRNAELKNAKTLLTGYLKYANGPGAKLIAHIDSNPFGIKTELKKKLTDGLKTMAEAIGTPA